jgi:small-conductance mechanosensitive channel
MSSRSKAAFFACLLLSAGAISAQDQDQTLADAARKAKEQKAQEVIKPKKVYTNDNVAAASSSSESRATTQPTDTNGKGSGGRTADQWKRLIVQQKAVVDSQQKQVDQLQASVHYVDANEYSNGPAYNAAQKKKQDRFEGMKSRLAEEQQKLDALKEQARKAGFGSSVYDQ